MKQSVIAGYNAVKAIAKLKDGTSFTVYYTKELNLANKDYDYQFKTLPGLALQYEWQSGKMKFTYTLSKINFDAIPASKFEIPKSGYRVLTYMNNKSLKKQLDSLNTITMKNPGFTGIFHYKVL